MHGPIQYQHRCRICSDMYVYCQCLFLTVYRSVLYGFLVHLLTFSAEDLLDKLQTRFARLMGEYTSSQKKMKQRVTSLEKKLVDKETTESRAARYVHEWCSRMAHKRGSEALED